MSEKTIIETIEYEIKTDCNLLYLFKKKKNSFNSYFYDDSDEVYSYYQLKYEYTFGYALFKLYCFCNYSIDDIYKLIKDLSSKYPKSDLKELEYSDFVNYTEEKHFECRKKVYEKSTKEHQNKLHLKESVESDNIKHLIDDYDSTNDIIETLNSDMKFICNDEDISAEKRITCIGKYSKISIRLDEKRSNLLQRIRAEKL